MHDTQLCFPTIGILIIIKPVVLGIYGIVLKNFYPVKVLLVGIFEKTMNLHVDFMLIVSTEIESLKLGRQTFIPRPDYHPETTKLKPIEAEVSAKP